jgi:hypothetical protein
MFNKGNKTDSEKKTVRKKVHKISYDEHFTRATESIDLAKNQKFTDIDDGISKRELSDVEKLSK